MKNLFFALLVALVTMSIAGCEKDYIGESKNASNNLANLVSSQFYLGVEVKEHETYGTMLSFTDLEAFWALEEVYSSSTPDEYAAWERGVDNFTSLRSVQWERYQAVMIDESGTMPMPDMFFPEVSAMVLNPDGYIMFGEKIYQAANQGRQMYLIYDDGHKELIHDLDAQNSRSSCSYDVDPKTVVDHYCGGNPTHTVNAEMGYYDVWFNSSDYVYAQTTQRITPCGQPGASSFAYGTLSFKGSYDVTIEGRPEIVTGYSTTIPGSNFTGWVQIVSGKQLCVNSVTMEHKAKYGNTTVATTHISN